MCQETGSSVHITSWTLLHSQSYARCVYPVVNGKEIPVPALLVEVHSSHFRDSMRKCILGVIEQLRLYRTANPDISSCIGFTFSKLPSASTDNLQSVIQDTSDCHMGEFPVLLWVAITGTWKSAGSLESSCSEEYASQMHKYPLEPDKGFLIRLSRKELECFGEEAAQVACQSAILVGSKDYYYKCQFLAFLPHLLHILCHNWNMLLRSNNIWLRHVKDWKEGWVS